MRSPRTTTKSSPRLPELEKARVQKQRPNATKNKQIKFLKINKSTFLLRIYCFTSDPEIAFGRLGHCYSNDCSLTPVTGTQKVE